METNEIKHKIPDKPGLWFLWLPWCKETTVVKVFWGIEGDLRYRSYDRDTTYKVNTVAPDNWLCPCLTPAEQVERLALKRRYHRSKADWNSARAIENAATALGLTLPEPEGGR